MILQNNIAVNGSGANPFGLSSSNRRNGHGNLTMTSASLQTHGSLDNNNSSTWESASPTSGIRSKGDVVFNSAAGEGQTAGWVCVNRQDTTIRVQANAGDTNIAVASTAGMSAGDIIGITLDDGTIQWSTISSITDAQTLVTAAGITAGRSAPVGSMVYTYRFKAMANLAS
jgi:hypothetical protein